MAHCTLIFLNRSEVTLATGHLFYLNTPTTSNIPSGDPAAGWPISRAVRRGFAMLARIMHHAALFLRLAHTARVIAPSDWIGVSQLAVQRVKGW